LSCHLAIPNIEVRNLYKSIILGWFKNNLGIDKYRKMLKALVNGDIMEALPKNKDGDN
jgi:hypothetical protein